MEVHITFFCSSPSKPGRQWKRLYVEDRRRLVFLQMVAQNRLRPHTIQTQQHYALKAVNYYCYYYYYNYIILLLLYSFRSLWSESVH